jgi:hypothetical protein
VPAEQLAHCRPGVVARAESSAAALHNHRSVAAAVGGGPPAATSGCSCRMRVVLLKEEDHVYQKALAATGLGLSAEFVSLTYARYDDSAAAAALSVAVRKLGACDGVVCSCHSMHKSFRCQTWVLELSPAGVWLLHRSLPVIVRASRWAEYCSLRCSSLR